MALPGHVVPVFAATTALAILLVRFASGSRRLLILMCAWLALQAVVANTGYYAVTDTLPPRLALAAGPPFVAIAGLFLTRAGRAFLDSLDLRRLTLLHVVRLPVELVLLWLCQAGLVPEIMTFEGRNFDIVAGVTAPIVALFAFQNGQPRRAVLLAWNVVCLGLVLNIAVVGMLSAPTPFQQFGVDQPNLAVLRTPFIWLPALIVPAVVLAHLAAIRQLTRTRGTR
jgi:hypothetical protein